MYSNMYICNPIAVSTYLSVKLFRSQNLTSLSGNWPRTRTVQHCAFKPMKSYESYNFHLFSVDWCINSLNWGPKLCFFSSFIQFNWSCFSNKISASPLDQHRWSNLSNFADTYAPYWYTKWHVRVPITPGVCKGTLRNSLQIYSTLHDKFMYGRVFFWYI